MAGRDGRAGGTAGRDGRAGDAETSIWAVFPSAARVRQERTVHAPSGSGQPSVRIHREDCRDMIRPQVGRTIEAVWAVVGAGATAIVCVSGLLAATWLGREPATPIGLDTGLVPAAGAPAGQSAAAGGLGIGVRPAPGPGATALTQEAWVTFPPPIAPRAPLPEPRTQPSTPPGPIPAATPSTAQPDPPPLSSEPVPDAGS